MLYFYIKAFHIIFTVTWFGGLLYLVRLFIYHEEARSKPAYERDILMKQYMIMARRLLYMITWPSALISLILGTTLFILQKYYLSLAGWMHLKFTLLILLYIYHIYCHRIYNRLNNKRKEYSPQYLRFMNGIAIFLLFSIVIIAVLKGVMDIQRELFWFIPLFIFLIAGIILYGKNRKKNENGSS